MKGFKDIMNSFNNKGNDIEKEKIEKKKAYKIRILNHLTYKELKKLSDEFIRPGACVKYVDEKGVEKQRVPTRDEYIESLFNKAPIDEILRLIPRTKSIE